MKAEEILKKVFDKYRFADYPYGETLEAVLEFADEVLKIAAEKARLKGERDCEYYEFYRAEDDVIRVNEESILNCLKE